MINIDRANRNKLNSAGQTAFAAIPSDINIQTKGKAALDFMQEADKLDASLAQARKATDDASYVANSVLNYTANIEQFEQQTKTNLKDPTGYAKSVVERSLKLQQDILDKAPSEEVRKSLTEKFGNTNTQLFKDSYKFETDKVIEKVNNDATNSLTSLANSVFQSPETINSKLSALEAVVELKSSVLNAEELKQFRIKAQKEILNSYVKGLININPDQAEQEIKSGNLNNHFDSNELDTFLTSVDTQRKQNEAKLESLINASSADTSVKLERALVDGNLTETDIYDAEDSGLLLPKDALDLVKKLRAKVGNDAEKIKTFKQLQEDRNSNLAIDTDLKENKEALDFAWEKMISPTIEKGNESATLKNFIQKYDYVPKAVKSSINANLFNGSPTQAAIGANMLNVLVQTNPILSSQFSEQSLVRAKKIDNAIKGGLAATEAVQVANTSIIQEGTLAHKLRGQELNTRISEGGYFKAGDFNEIFRNDPDTFPDVMINQFDSLMRTFYQDGGLDYDSAQELAVAKLKSQWSVVKRDGQPVWEKDSPELHYGKPGQDNSWIRKQLLEDIKSSIGQNVSDEQVIITPSPRKFGEKPSYNIFFISENGLLEPILDKNNEYDTWRPTIKNNK